MNSPTSDDTQPTAPGLGFRPPPSPDFCPHCARPMPASLLDAAFFLCGDPELRGDLKQFARNMRELLVSGLDLGSAHYTRLLDLYLDRHKLFADHCRDRRTRGEAAHV